MKQILIALYLLISQNLASEAQKADTLRIKAGDINTRVLNPGMHRWLVYFKMGADSPRIHFNIWSREIAALQYNGKEAISIRQVWEDGDSIHHRTYSVCDRKDFSPLYHETWWKQTGLMSFDYASGIMKINNREITDQDTAAAVKKKKDAFKIAQKEYHLNWHLDLEVFPTLPYKENRTFLVNFYDPGFSAPQYVAYTVIGSKMLKEFDYEGIDCWILEHKEKNNHEIFWISKKTHEVLKLEQQFGTRYRYKIKLAFSN